MNAVDLFYPLNSIVIDIQSIHHLSHLHERTWDYSIIQSNKEGLHQQYMLVS